MSSQVTYKDYKDLAPEFSQRLWALMRKMPPKALYIIAKEIGISHMTLLDLLQRPNGVRRITMLIKVERYLDKMEKEFK